MSESIQVELGERAYTVQVGDGLLDSGRLLEQVPGRHALIVTDANKPVGIVHLHDLLRAGVA